MKKFTKFEQAAIKSTAKSVYRFYEQKEALDRKVEEYRKKIEGKKAEIDSTIDAFEASVKFLSGGYTTKDLCITEMVDGKRRFTLKPQETLDMLDNPELAAPAGEPFSDEPVPSDIPPMPDVEELEGNTASDAEEDTEWNDEDESDEVSKVESDEDEDEDSWDDDDEDDEDEGSDEEEDEDDDFDTI